MNTIKEAYNKLLKKEKPNGFLCSVFVMCAPNETENLDWQLDFYNEKEDTINSYLIKENTIEKLNIESKPFKEENKKINKLNLDNVKIDYKEALAIAEKENKESISKIIILLQNINTEVWNISFFTLSFNLINIKIDAKNKKILEKSNTPLIHF